MKSLLASLFFLSICSFSYAQTTYYVPDDFSTIQSGIDGSQNGDTVIVRDGTYNEIVTLSSRAITLESENGPASTFISGLGLTGLGVVNCINGEGSDTIVDGFTITEGYTTDHGGVYLSQSAPKLINLVLQRNKYGLTAANSSTIDISDSVITGNEWTGLFCSYSTGNVTSCEVIDNLGIGGEAGGFYIYYSTLTIVDTLISSNQSYGDGGGINGYYSDVTISECEISNNSTDNQNARQGGGLYLWVCDLIIVDSSLENNTSHGNGGGIYSNGVGHSIDRCVIQGNNAGNEGGGMYLFNLDDWVVVTNSIFRGNNANHNAGVYIFLNDWNERATFENCLFESNQASTGSGGLRITGGLSTTTYIVEINYCTMVDNIPTAMEVEGANGSSCTNSIFWGNTVSSTFPLSYCCIEGGQPGIGNTPYDPLFTSGGQGLYYLSQVQAGQPTNSSCLDTGDPSGVLPYGTTRSDEILDTGRPDIGYHYPADTTDTDYDGIPDRFESSVTFTNPNDDDTDDDGLSDGEEYYHLTLNLDPLNFDTDGDSLGDGLESGMSNVNRLTGTDPAVFVPDSDPSTTTSPVREDSDAGGVIDSAEDKNLNGRVDLRETNPAPGNGNDDILTGVIIVIPPTLSMGSGGIAEIMLDFDTKYASERFMVLCSTTGNDVGFNLGSVHVPINFGAMTAQTLYGNYYNQMVNFDSSLNLNGDALASIVMPPNSPSSFAGLTLHFAALVVPPAGYPLTVTDSTEINFVQ